MDADASTKRDRESNWTEDEKNVLRAAVSKYIDIIDNKRNDAKMISLKVKTWRIIQEQLEAKGYCRQTRRIKQQWSRMKLNAKLKLRKSTTPRERIKIEPPESDDDDDSNSLEIVAPPPVKHSIVKQTPTKVPPTSQRELRSSVSKSRPIEAPKSIKETFVSSIEADTELEIGSPLKAETELLQEIHELQVQKLRNEIVYQKELHELQIVHLKEMHVLKKELLERQIKKETDIPLQLDT